ncbi:MAG TPA: RDD family protein [Methylomirabilota bacterium]|nr:RDD family protein [Methylomirabilota bacterium]
MNRTSVLLIKTPEGVVFAQTLASPVVRFLAWLIDFACLWVLLITVNIAVTFIKFITPDAGQAIQLIAFFVITIGYAMVLEWKWRGQTIGKRVMRLRVVDGHGLRLKFHQVAIRNLVRIIDSPPLPFDFGGVFGMIPTFYVVGGLAALLTKKSQRLGDLAANTVVIRIPRLREPNLDQLGADKYNSLRAHPHLCARLRQRVSPAEASTALQAIIRRDEFDPAARVQLFSELAAHFKSKVEFPPEAIEGIGDEQYVRNVTDVIYRTESKRSAVPPGAGTRPGVGSTLVA